jgi:hypothetical protein
MSDVELEFNQRRTRGTHDVELPPTKDVEELSYTEGESSPVEEKLGEA